jgi:uncharacterized protein YbjT (DUF2867 family)
MPGIPCCILGATGFIGGQIAPAAVARGELIKPDAHMARPPPAGTDV